MGTEAERKLNELLLEAHTNEIALVEVLSAHAKVAQEPSYRELLEEHIDETRRHASLVEERLDEKGATRSPLRALYGTVQLAMKQGLTLAKGPIDLVRGGTDRTEKQLRNAMDEVMTEGMEIAAYDAIEATALATGDEQTARLAATIRADEERMLERLRGEIARLGAAHGGSDRRPWPGYDDMSAQDVVARLSTAGTGLKARVHAYETQTKNRATVLRACEPTPYKPAN